MQSFGIKTDNVLWSPTCDRNTDRTNKELSRRVEAKGPSLYSDVRMCENSTPLDPVGSFEFYIKGRFRRYDFLLRLSHAISRARAACVM